METKLKDSEIVDELIESVRHDTALAGLIRERCGGFVSQIRNGNSRNYRIR